MFLKFASSICRVCLGAEAKVPLFEGSGCGEKFKSATKLEISAEDGLPTSLCENCSARLEAAYEFQTQSISSDQRLRSFVSTINSKFAAEVQTLHDKSLSSDVIKTEPFNEAPTPSNEKHTNLEIDIISESAETSNQVDEQKIDEDDIVAVNYSYMESIEDSCTTDDQDQKDSYLEETQILDCNYQEADGEEEESSLQASIRSKPSNTCRHCGKLFSSRTSLARHLLTHSNIKPYECPVCHTLFTQNGSLKQHMLRHTGERPHICMLCGRGFTRRRLLRMHERIHTGEKPYHCDECNLSFTVKEGLRRHNIHKHSTIQVKIYKCEICDKKLHSKYTLRNHMQLHEKDALKGHKRKLNVKRENEGNDAHEYEEDIETNQNEEGMAITEFMNKEPDVDLL